MPTYEYQCDACEHAFEQYQAITAAPLKKCPECGKSKLRRLMGAGGGIIFKGSGFYQTDYRSDGYKKAAEADSSGGKKEATDSGSKSADSAGSKPADGAKTSETAAAKSEKPDSPKRAPAKGAEKKTKSKG